MTKFTWPRPTHLCANPDCSDREWKLECLAHGLWRLHSQKGVFTLAASAPCCPRCGAVLLEIAALEINPRSGVPAIQ